MIDLEVRCARRCALFISNEITNYILHINILSCHQEGIPADHRSSTILASAPHTVLV